MTLFYRINIYLSIYLSKETHNIFVDGIQMNDISNLFFYFLIDMTAIYVAIFFPH